MVVDSGSADVRGFFLNRFMSDILLSGDRWESGGTTMKSRVRRWTRAFVSA
jgi:hypothetical protein